MLFRSRVLVVWRGARESVGVGFYSSGELEAVGHGGGGGHAACGAGTSQGGDVRARNSKGPCLGVQGVAWAHAGVVGWLGMVLVGRGGRGTCVHAGCSTVGLAGRAPAMAGRGGGPGTRGCHGELQGDTGYLLDVLVHALGAGWDKMTWWWHVHGMACLG